MIKMSELRGNLTFESYRGPAGLQVLDELAELRIEVFREFPYLYDGDKEYEAKYLGRYFESPHSFVMCARLNGELIGATTAIWLPDESPMITEAFQGRHDLETVVYFGESLIRRPFRGRGLGKKFFAERELFAKTFDQVRWTSFCSVIRDANDPRRSAGDRSPEHLWWKMGYHPVVGMECKITWKEIGENSPSPKRLQFWVKQL